MDDLHRINAGLPMPAEIERWPKPKYEKSSYINGAGVFSEYVLPFLAKLAGLFVILSIFGLLATSCG